MKKILLLVLLTLPLFAQTGWRGWKATDGWVSTSQGKVPTMDGALKLLVDPGRQIFGEEFWNETLGVTVVSNGNMNNFTGGVDANVKGHWIFDSNYHTAETGDSIHKDQSGNGNDLTRNGWSSYSDMLDSLTGSNPAYQGGNALSFDGVNDYFDGGDILNSGIGDFSVAAWLKTTTVNKKIVSKRAVIGWDIAVSTGGKLNFAIRDGDSGTQAALGITNIADGNWHHIVVVFDRSANAIGYVDGVVESTPVSIVNESGSIDNTDNFTIGSFSDGTILFNGQLAELSYHNKALSAQEILDLKDLANGYTSSGSITPTNNNFAQRFTNSLVDSAFEKTVTTTANTLYKLEFDGYRVSGSGNLTVDLSGAHTETFTYNDAVSTTQTEYFLATTTSLTVKFYGSVAGDVYEVDNLKIREVTNAAWSDAQLVEDWSLGGKVVGSNLATNGTFVTDSDWSKGTGWSISGGTASCDGTQIGNSDLSQSISAVANTIYEVIYTVSGYSAGNLTPLIGTASGLSVSANGTYKNYISAQAATLFFRADVNFVGSIDNVTAKAITNGNHGLAKGGLEDGQPAHTSALLFDGVNDYVDYGDVLDVGVNDFLLFSWVKMFDRTANGKIISKRSGANQGFDVYVNSTSFKMSLAIKDAVGSIQNIIGNTVIQNDTWYCLVWVFDRDINATGYINNSAENAPIDISTINGDIQTTDNLTFQAFSNGTLIGNGKLGLSGIYIFDGQDGAPSSLPSDFEDSIIQVLFDNTQPSDFEGGYILFVVWIPIRRRKQYMRAA